MSDNTERPQWIRPALASGLAVVAAAALVFGVSQLAGDSDDDVTVVSTDDAGASDDDAATDPGEEDEVTGDMTFSTGGQLLPERMNGQDAIDALGDRISTVAERNGKTVDELKDLLLRDSTAYVTPSGMIVYLDDFGQTAPPSSDDS